MTMYSLSEGQESISVYRAHMCLLDKGIFSGSGQTFIQGIPKKNIYD